MRARTMVMLLALAACAPKPDPGIYGADGSWRPTPACENPTRPTSHEPIAISEYQDKRQGFMDCVRGEAAANGQVNQHDLDLSLAAIGEDQTDALGGIQQDVRGAAGRIGSGGR